MKKLGELLKSERIKQKLELADIAAKTKIGLSKLELIERSDYEALPAKVFTRGLIKSYAKQLKLDVDSIINLFEDEYDGQDDIAIPIVTPSTNAEPPKEEEEKQAALFLFQAPKSFFLLLGFAVTAVLCVFIYMTLQKISSYEKEEVDPSAELAELDDFSNKLAEPQPEKNEIPVAETPIKKIVKKIESKATPTQPPPTQSEARAAALQKIAQSELQKMERAKKARPAALRDQKLLIEAFEPVRLEIFWSTGKPQVMLLKADETKKIIFNDNIKIHLSDGGVVNVTHNDRDLGVPGQIRKPIELKYP